MAKRKGTAKDRLTYSVEEAADALGISVKRAYQDVRSGNIPSIKFGRRLIIPRVALEKKLENADT